MNPTPQAGVGGREMTVCVFVSVCTSGVQGRGSEQPGFWVSLVGQLPSRLEFRRDTRPVGLGPLGLLFHEVKPIQSMPMSQAPWLWLQTRRWALSPEGRVSTGQAGVPAAPWAAGETARVAGVMGSSLQQREGLHTWAWRPGAPPSFQRA